MYFCLLFIGFLMSFSSIWAFQYFGLSCFEQIVFHLKVPLEGTNPKIFIDYIRMCISKALVCTLITYLLFFHTTYVESISIFVFIVNFVFSAYKIELFTFISNIFKKTNIYETYYVDPKQVKLTFPTKKRNLIYIYLESMENTYTSKENGGNYDIDLIPELSALAKDNISFSNTSKMGGATVVSGTGWTTGGIVAQSAGIPLLVPFTCKRFTEKTAFLPGAYSLGDILEKEGYNQTFCIGSTACFGGREYYFKKHGNYRIFDIDKAKEENRLEEGYRVFWGFEDDKLFHYAKEEILSLYAQGKPFNFTMLTVDTHHPYGYKDNLYVNEYKEELSNIIRGSSKKVGAFIEWLKQQPFYEDTTIVITGDHISMAAEYINHTYDKDYERTIYNCFINAKNKTTYTCNRKFTSFDMYPTILSALGVQIENDALGLGVNLFSDKKTMLEKESLEYINKELKKQSNYYKNTIL